MNIKEMTALTILANLGLSLDQVEMTMFGIIGGIHRSQIAKAACHWANMGRVRRHAVGARYVYLPL